MKANPGGQIDPGEIVGRDGLIQTLWETLERQSVLLTAERRIGKTCVIQKMQAQPPSGWFPIYQDLEGVRQAEEFALRVYDQVQAFLSRWRKTANRTRRFLDERNIQVPGVVELAAKDRSWKQFLVHAVEDLVAEQEANRLVFLWDEVPYMLENIRRRQNEDTAMEVLDVLRSLRQTHAAFRIVFTGSIGLHHVLARLKAAHAGNEPVNDMYAIEVRALAPVDGEELARRLIQGEGLTCRDTPLAAAAIAREADYVPFYIHHIVRCLKVSQRPADPERVAEVIAEQLVDANDPWELGHYRDRIADYYPDDQRQIERILDELAEAEEPLTVNDLLGRLQAQTDQLGDRNVLLKLLRLMERDHYLTRNPDAEYGFLFPLVKRWWKLDRGL